MLHKRAILSRIRRLEKAHISGRAVLHTRAILSRIRNTEEVFLNGLTVLYLKVFMTLISAQVVSLPCLVTANR